MKDFPVAISIVMGVYNCEDYLQEAVDSILTQTFRDFEFIIIDDGSTDGSRRIIEAYEKKDSRIVAIYQQNIGLTKSLNVGLNQAKGEYIARMDGDDIAMPYRLERQYHALKYSPELVLIGAEVELISSEGLQLGIRRHPHRHEDIRSQLLLGNGGAMTHPVVMFRRSTVLEVGCYDEEFNTTQDLDLFLRLTERGKAANLPEVLLSWRQHSSSINRTRSETWLQMKMRALKKTADRLGMDAYLQEMLSSDSLFQFPSEPLELARFARAGNRPKSVFHFCSKAIFQRPLSISRIVSSVRCLLGALISYLR